MQEAYYPQEEGKSFREYLEFIGRRRLPILLTALVVAVMATAVAVLLPPVFRSTATILIEEQEIPPDLVRTTISSYADQRIQVISQQVMTRSNLMQIVEKYQLYVTERKRETSEEILERMRKDIKLDLVTADVIDRRSGAKTSAAIAFTLSFDSESAEKTQKVANELVSLFLNENLKNRQQKVAETTTFLQEEATRLSTHISEIEDKQAQFKRRHMDTLPELIQLNLQVHERTDAELAEVDRQLRSVGERRFYLEAQLAQIKPNSPIVSAGGERILDTDERLRALEAQYSGISGVYEAEHPDVKRMKREIEALRQEGAQSGEQANEVWKQLDKLRTDLLALRERYSEDHPDVITLSRKVNAIEKALASAEPSAVGRTAAPKPENPTYITFQAQLDALNNEARALEIKRDQLRVKRTSYEGRLERTPQVEAEYLDLSRNHENSVLRYRELKSKLMEAEVAQELEKGSKAERFSLIDPPQYPEKPRSPNRPAIFLVGLVLAMGGGFGYAGVLEGLDGSIKGAKQIAQIVPLPLLTVIPFLESDAERKGRRRRRLLSFVLAGAVVVATLAAIHFYWMPLEVLWYTLVRRLWVF